jgi:hypothetical protein
MKLSGLTIIIIALCAGLCGLSYAYWDVYAPSETAAANNHAYHDALEAEANKQGAAVKRVEKAMDIVRKKAEIWNFYVASKTPSNALSSGGIDVNENAYQLVVDSPKFRNSAQRAFNAQLRQGGVKIVASPELPQPTDSEKDILASYYNYPAFSFPVVLWELGSVTVTGTYAQISKNVRAWKDMPHYLAVVDGLRIDGTSPNLTASYNVTLVGFIRSTNVFPSWAPTGVPMTASTSTPGTAPGKGPAQGG